MRKSAIGLQASELSNSATIFSLIATGAATSRSALLKASGIARATLSSRLAPLLQSGIVVETEKTTPSGGRPSRVLEVNSNAGYVLVANFGETFVRIATMDLQANIISQETMAFTTQNDPVATLEMLADAFSALVGKDGLADRFLAGIGLSLPAPIDVRIHSVVRPSVLPDWAGFDITGWFSTRYRVPVHVEKDVNLMAIYEHERNFPDVDDMFFIKAGTGIGSGIITGGRLFRGAQGGAGDIGHIQFSSDHAPLCRCGKLGCVEARAAGWALARDLRATGYQAENSRDVVHLVDQNKPEAIMSVRKAGQVIGEATADVVSLLNPSLVVVGGTLAQTGDFLLAGVRELVYQRCLPLATHDLRIVSGATTLDTALGGAALIVLDDAFSQDSARNFLLRFAESRSPIPQ